MSLPVASPSARIAGKPAWVAAVAYLIYILFLFRHPLLNPKVLLSGFDMPIFYAYKSFWVQSILAGDPALWNPYSDFGNGFLADPGVGAFSPFNLLHFFLSPTYAFTWEAILHFWMAAFGAYLFMASIGCRALPSFFTGFVYAFGAFLIVNNGEAQCILWWGVAWLPIIMFFLNKTVETRKNGWLLATAACLAFSFFEGEPQVTQYNFMFCGFYLFYAWLSKKMGFVRMAATTAGLVAVFVVLAACSLLPSLDFARVSNRWGWKIGNIMTENLDPVSLKAFLNPFFQGSPFDGSYHGRWGFHASTNYIGWVPLALFGAGFFLTGKIPRMAWMIVMSLLFTLLSMGNSTPISTSLFMFFYDWVPFFSHHRTISRMMFLTQFAMACGAGLVLDYWITLWQAKRQAASPSGRPVQAWFAILILGLTFVDLAKFDLPFERTVDPGILTDRDQVFPDPMMQWALDDKGYYRVQPANRICANLHWHLFQPITYDYTTAESSADFIALWDQYPDSPLSDIVALKYVMHPRITPDSKRFKQVSPNLPHFCVNQEPQPRAFLAGGYRIISGGFAQAEDMLLHEKFDYRHEILLDHPPADFPVSNPQASGAARITRYSNNEVVVHCQVTQPMLLFLSDVVFPGWKAEINGRPTDILTADGLFRAVAIPKAGDFEVRMSYWPTGLTTGLWISTLGWLGLLGYLFWWIRGRRKAQVSPVAH